MKTTESRYNGILYVFTVLIWGSTWLAIKFQLGSVDPMISVTWRFAIAALLLNVYCRLSGLNMRFSPKEHMFMAMQGAFLFALNYWLFYVAELYITSGLAAVIFSTIVFMNIINGSILLKSPVYPRVVTGAFFGAFGIGLVFWPELSSFTLSDNSFVGLLLCIGATLSASFGNIISARNQRFMLPVIQTNAFGMGYGAVLMGIFSVVTGKAFTMDVTFVYIGSLLYLSVFGSIIAFGCYLTLIGRIGADRAAYTSLLFPIVALGISTVYEGYQWSLFAFAGVLLILFGNFLAISNKKPLPA